MYNATVVDCGVIGTCFAERFADQQGMTLWGTREVVEEGVERSADT